MIDFHKTIQQGKSGELIFKEDFLTFLNIKYIDVTDCQKFQLIDTDYLAKIGNYEIKSNYKDNDIIIIEEFTNCNIDLAPISKGWFYKSKADMMVFISKESRWMILIPFNDNFKNYYESIKENYNLIKNQFSCDYKTGNKWQSAFRKIPLESLKGYYAKYKKCS